MLNVGADRDLIDFFQGKGTGLRSRAINLIASFSTKDSPVPEHSSKPYSA
ncbi:Hypothetical protein CulFRC58_2077 [Corynebacterium ulcerans FRC58]|uniref:Uncharacterized protein n=1 Tax=Corynebacterium ulcerans FRC58 TaxID=1408268 RepID=A0ABM5U3X2_CORUL|nr:Hypothetical protein CulFRC58_2077 [Corynebacterium ulcerans FRC58]